jgi:hypothetical protein
MRLVGIIHRGMVSGAAQCRPGAAASTYFWVDPQEEFIDISMAQFQPSGYHPIDQDFRVTAYQAIVD